MPNPSARHSRRLALVAWLALASPLTAAADQGPHVVPYALETPGGRFVFVMLGGGDADSPSPYRTGKFGQSGMYPNDGSATPLWTVDWSAYVFLPSDGVHVVRRGGWPRLEDVCAQEAISFFASGRLLKTYRVCDLIDAPALLPRTSSHYEWQRPVSDESRRAVTPLEGGPPALLQQGVVFDEDAGTMTLATALGDTYVFDYRTGEMVSARRPLRRAALALAAACAAACVAGLLLVRRIRRKRRAARPAPSA